MQFCSTYLQQHSLAPIHHNAVDKTASAKPGLFKIWINEWTYNCIGQMRDIKCSFSEAADKSIACLWHSGSSAPLLPPNHHSLSLSLSLGRSDCHTVRLSDCQTVRRPVWLTVTQSDWKKARLSDCRTVRLSDCQTVKFWDFQTKTLTGLCTSWV